ncbi:hypothetical protein DFH09DRAFT_1314635 [Mycena vulgaris]|nr:hypothetical protein DFH09DRAFT_1314635 [Mycena vulgaris]
MSSKTNTPLSTPQDFIHEAFIEAIISPDDAVFNAALPKFWAPHVQEKVTTSPRARISHLQASTISSRAYALQFSNRKFVKETFVVATPADPSNRTGAVAATHVFSALQDGTAVTVTIVAVQRIKWVEEGGHGHGGRREIVAEAFITSTLSS